MDGIDELIAYCEAWEPGARVMGNVCAGDAEKTMRSVRAEIAECKQDAERFRWLKKVGNYDSAYQYAIDAAMAGGEQ